MPSNQAVIGELVAKIKADYSELTSAFGDIDKKMGGLDQKFTDFGKSIASTGKQLTMKLTAPILGIGLASFKMAGDFDQAMRKVNVMLQASSEQVAEYKDRILEISSATARAAGDVTDAYYQIVSAGYRGADSMDILEVAMKGAVGGASDAVAVTAALTKAMNIFGLTGPKGATRAMDTFFGIVDTGLLTFEELVGAFPRAATMAAGLGVSIEDVGAALGTLTRVIGSTDEAATSLNAMFNALIQPSKEMLALYQEWGVTTGQQAIEKFGGLVGVLQAVQVATGGEIDKLSELFPNIRAISAVLPLATTSFDDLVAAEDAVTNATGRTNDAFNEMAQGPGFQWQQFLNNAKISAIELGDAISQDLGPMLTDLTDTVRSVVKWFGELSPGTQSNLIKAAGALAALGPGLMAVGMAAQGIGAIAKFLPMVVGSAGGPIGLIVGAAAAEGLAVKAYLDESKAVDKRNRERLEAYNEFRNAISELQRVESGAFKVSDEHYRKLIQDAADYGQSLLDLNAYQGEARDILEAYVTGYKEYLSALDQAVVANAALAESTDIATEASMKQAEALASLNKEINDIIERFQYEQSEAGKLRVTFDDIVSSLYAAGVGADWMTTKFGEMGDAGKDVNAILEVLGLKPSDIAGFMAGEKTAGFIERQLIRASQREDYTLPPLEMPEYQYGGVVPGAPGQPVPVLAHAGEVISPAGQAGITNNFNISQLVVREEADVKKVARQLYIMQQLRT